VRYLVERGANVNKVGPELYDHQTPLELARKLKHAECEQALLGQ
jgi:hypothetical protein